MKPSQLFEGKNSSLYKTFMKTKKNTIKGVKETLDEVYAIGFKNGQIEMRNRVLMKINRDIKFWINVKADYVMNLLKTINKLPLTKKITPITKVVKNKVGK